MGRNTKMIRIEEPDKFMSAVLALGGGKTLTGLSMMIADSQGYIAQACRLGKIAESRLGHLASILGITMEKAVELTRKDEEAPRCEEGEAGGDMMENVLNMMACIYKQLREQTGELRRIAEDVQLLREEVMGRDG